ncbi:hypothetical protein NOC27_2141 [Nitrosococcus oceani AFC27]|nr:hypothetical protein NOC27_2141 [Nitrosococcus oceani AFC27]
MREGELLACGEWKQRCCAGLLVSEIMTVVIYFHHSHYRHFKGYYLGYVRCHLKEAFPRLVSYQRFVAPIPSVLIPLGAYLQQRKGRATGVAFMDSPQVFKKIAGRGKTSRGWFYGFKLHRLINDWGELLAFHLTPGLSGKLFGDNGYISKHLFQALFEKGLQLITPPSQK